MLVLALEASTGVASAAVARTGEGREILAEAWALRGASEALLPAAHDALGLAGVDLEQVERILVGVGPGTFTGIRIAAAAARSLSLATGAALSRNSTLSALAAPALASVEPGGSVLSVLDAKRRQVFAQVFGGGAGGGELLCAAPADLPEEFDAGPASDNPPLIVGDGAVRYREVLRKLGRVPPDASPLHRVTATGHLLSADLSPVPPGEVVPIYVREPDAEARRDLNPWSRR